MPYKRTCWRKDLKDWLIVRPNKPGYYLALKNDEVYLLEVVMFDNGLHCDTIENDDYYLLNGEYFDGFLWGPRYEINQIGSIQKIGW